MNTEEYAAPGMVDPTSFQLDNSLKNKAKLTQLKKLVSRQIGVISLRTGEQLPILRSGVEQGNIFVEYNETLALYIQYHTYHYPFLPVRSITQTKLWRSKDLPVSNTFSPTLFFKIILAQTGAVLSDLEHTPDGTEFWKRRLGEALAKNLNVALVNFGARTWTQIRSKKELEVRLNETWGGGMQAEQFKQLRWMIWK